VRGAELRALNDCLDKRKKTLAAAGQLHHVNRQEEAEQKMLNKTAQSFALFLWLLSKICERFVMFLNSYRFEHFGKRSLYHPFSTILLGHENLSLGDHSTIGPNCTIYCIDSKLIIGKKTGIGPGSIIMTGNHSTHLIGKFYKDYNKSDKLPGDDAVVVIGEDVWIGAGCILLKGAMIGRGSIVGAGSLINKPIPPYSIAVGSPAKVTARRFTVSDILAHEALLYTTAQQFQVDYLTELESNFEALQQEIQKV